MNAFQPMPPVEPIPLAFVTGFLGAGKTTLLNRLLRASELADTLVVVNEFGEIGLDHLLVEHGSGEAVLLPSGCLCCQVQGDLLATLEDLLRRRDNGRIAPFKRVVVETSGLADPIPALATLLRHPYLPLRYRLTGIVTLVDAVNGQETLARHEEAVRQVVQADWLVLTMLDRLPDPAALPALKERLAHLNPAATIIEAGQATSAILEAADLESQGRRTARILSRAESRSSETPHLDKVRSFTLQADEPIARQTLDLFIELLHASRGSDVLRVKGLVATKDDPEHPLLIQAAQHLVHPPLTLPAWPDADRTTRLVFIVRDIDPTFIAGLWDAFRG